MEGARVRFVRVGHPVSAAIQAGGRAGGKPGSALALVAAKSLFQVDPRGARRRLMSGRRPLASTPALLDEGKGPAGGVLVGCDDGALYRYPGGRPLVQTGLDVYSSPVVFRAPGHPTPLCAFGSDDGGLWCVDGEGATLAGFPFRCEGFVSATPAVADLEGQGHPQLLVGDWAGNFHAVGLDARERPGFPRRVEGAIWSSACAADIDGDGRLEVVFAAYRLHALRADGTPVAGFPRRLGSYTVGSPIVVDLFGDGRAAAIVGSDRLYAFDGAGHNLPGFPVDLGAYLWASPVAAAVRGERALSLFAGAWDGALYEVRPGAAPLVLVQTRGPIFGAPAVLVGAEPVVCVGSWDGRVYLVERPQVTDDPRNWPVFHRTPQNVRTCGGPFAAPQGPAAGPEEPPAAAPPRITGAAIDPPRPRHRKAVFVRFASDGAEGLARGQLLYRIAGEAREHPSPVVRSGGALVSLVQPLGLGRRVSFHLEGQDAQGGRVRFPEQGEESFLVSRVGPLPLGALASLLGGRP